MATMKEIKKRFNEICEDFLFNSDLREDGFSDPLREELDKMATTWEKLSEEQKGDATKITEYEATIDSFGIDVELYAIYDEGYHWFAYRMK